MKMKDYIIDKMNENTKEFSIKEKPVEWLTFEERNGKTLIDALLGF